MTSRQRVIAAMEHQPTDRVPTYHASLSSRAASIVLGREAYIGGGIQQWRESTALWHGPDAHAEFLERSRRDAFDLARALDVDLVRPSYWRLTERPTARLDPYRFLYGDPEGAYRLMRFDPQTELYQIVKQHPKPEEDIEQATVAAEQAAATYKPGPRHFPHLLDAIDAFKGQRAIMASGIGIGIPNRSEAWLAAIALRPDLVARYLDAQAERAVRTARCFVRMGLRMLAGGLDFATNKGPLYSPRAFRELMLPRLKRISEACHKAGAYHLFASDGNLWPVADDLFGNSGVEGYYEIDRRAGMELRSLRARFPHLSLIGNISSYTLHLGSREHVVAEALSCLEAAKEQGSIIVGCSNQIVSQTPLKNLLAMLNTIRDHR